MPTRDKTRSFRDILNRENGTIDEASFAAFTECLDCVEGWPVDEEIEVEPLEVPPPIEDDGDPRLQEIAERWLSALAPILDHPVMGDVVRRILEEPEGAERAPQLPALDRDQGIDGPAAP